MLTKHALLRAAAAGVCLALFTAPTVTAARAASGGSGSAGSGGKVTARGFVTTPSGEPTEATTQVNVASFTPPPPGSTPKQRWEITRRMIAECNEGGGDPAELCPWDPDTGAPAAPLSRTGAESVVRQVVAELQLPAADPQVGPDPAWNEWKMAVVGVPLWLWTDGPRTMAASNSDHGLTVTLDARHRSTVFTMGDGTTRTCATTQPYDRATVAPGTPSPACGHSYQLPPRHGDTYRVTATTHWVVHWSAAGHSGTLPTSMTASRDLPVTELQAVVVRSR